MIPRAVFQTVMIIVTKVREFSRMLFISALPATLHESGMLYTVEDKEQNNLCGTHSLGNHTIETLCARVLTILQTH